MIYYVDQNAASHGQGTEEAPFLTIQEAAEIALPGDEVIVSPGLYREHVHPVHAGTEEKRIVYRSKESRKAIISGAEEVKDWKKTGDGIWECRIPNSRFTKWNPYTTFVEGDWYARECKAHLGEIYLNDKSMYEVFSKEELYHPEPSLRSWYPEDSLYVWYTEQDEKKNETVILANFHGSDPTVEKPEICFRRFCFYPKEEGIGYITLSGFCVEKAAPQWAPPTAYQEGMVGPHWSKGWIIEDCEISNAKCSGISLGKYRQEGNDNKWLRLKYKDGTQTERECICQAQREGWLKENIGSHIVRNCEIHDCGQTGIVGHLGGVFSLIENNHIHHINTKQNIYGAEVGGIKMHAAIDVTYRGNHIHHCTRGLWLDWQAQGTRVTGNVFHHNTLPYEHLMHERMLGVLGEDIFVEVSHGPTLIDNNLLLSTRSLKFCAQGIAVVHNLITGSIAAVGTGVENGAKVKKSVRYTPYHVPHRTEIAGFMTILHGDVRFYNNIFVQQKVHPFFTKCEKEIGFGDWDDHNATCGLKPYNEYQTYEEWDEDFQNFFGYPGASDRYYMPLPVWVDGNAYFNGAIPWKKEEHPLVNTTDEAVVELTDESGEWKWSVNLGDLLKDADLSMISTETLGEAFEPEEKFETPDGEEIVFDTDFYGRKRTGKILPGPFAEF